jgi:hypothetical protein
MPTSRPRHTLTETDELRDVLDRAQALFPEARSRKALLEQLVKLGDAELRRRQREEQEERARVRERLEYLADASTGIRPGIDFDALERIRHEHYRGGLA